MARKAKHSEVNLYYANRQARENNYQKEERKKAKEREKRIKQNNKMKQQDDFDIETETVIKMTNQNKIKKDKEKREKLEKQEKKRRIRNKKIMIVVKIFLMIAIIAGGITFALVSPIFNIKEIKVLNNSTISTDTIISLSKLKIDENIFKFLKMESIKEIKTNPYIQDVEIHRKLPNTIEINVEERKHKYSVDFLGQYAYINNQGYILEISEDSKQKTIIQGITTKEEEITPGNRLNNDDLEKLEDVIKIMHAAKEYKLDLKITNIDISNKNEYNIYLEEEKKKVHLGDSNNLGNKFLYVNAIIEQEAGKVGDIFANGDINNRFKVYFRESLNV